MAACLDRCGRNRGDICGARLKQLPLEFHGMVFLLAAAGISGLLSETFGALAGIRQMRRAWVLALLGLRDSVLCGDKPCRVNRGLAGSVDCVCGAGNWVVVALAVEGLVGLVSLRIFRGSYLAFIRTFVVCAATIALAFSGAHWRRMELTRIGYAALALLAVSWYSKICGTGIWRLLPFNLSFCDYLDCGSASGADGAKGLSPLSP